MANPARATLSLLIPDYPPDKICFKKRGVISVPQAPTISDSTSVVIPHNLGYAPLPLGIYSIDNYATWFEFGTSPYQKSPTFGSWGPIYLSVIEATDTNITVAIFNDSGATQSVSYSIVCLVPDNIDTNTLMDINERNDILFNSSDNYLKTYLDNSFSGSFDGLSSQTFTIPHNLGNLPLALVFSEESGIVRRAGSESQLGVTGIDTKAALDNTNLYIYGDAFFAMDIKYHYKVYLNE
jgi:hypothetical protein